MGLNLVLRVDLLIHLLTAGGLTPCGSNTVNIYTKTVCSCVDTFVTAVRLTPCSCNTVHIYTQIVC